MGHLSNTAWTPLKLVINTDPIAVKVQLLHNLNSAAPPVCAPSGNATQIGGRSTCDTHAGTCLRWRTEAAAFDK